MKYTKYEKLDTKLEDKIQKIIIVCIKKEIINFHSNKCVNHNLI